VDILVVVDNSPGMAEEQASLADAFPLLIGSLLDPPEGDHELVTDLHVGVISTDMGTGGYAVEGCTDPIDGDDGCLQHSPNPSVGGCEAAYPLYLSYDRHPDCPVDLENLEWMTTGFPCLATLGTDGCVFEQPLEASVRALIDHRDGVNAGFLRPDSVLVILFVTDENDCSVAAGQEGFFDEADASLGMMGLRCFHHPAMLGSVETYLEAFESLKTDPDKLFVAFLVGVPRGAQCEGLGSEIPSCHDHPDMIEQIDPVSMTSLVPSCASSRGEAYPAGRFVQVAQSLGPRALVRSICADDFEPAIGTLTDRIHEIVDSASIVRELDTETDEDDPCRCIALCTLIEALSDLRPCDTEGKPCYRPEGPGTPCADPEVDPDGIQHTLCEIPQAGTRMSPCEPGVTGCNDAGITHTVDGEGWYYMGRNWTEEPGDILYAEPEIRFTDGMQPAEGSNVYIQCESFICPENRQCGPEEDPSSICCEFDEYCDRSVPASPTCRPRPD
jgi:hypothetical protein